MPDLLATLLWIKATCPILDTESYGRFRDLPMCIKHERNRTHQR